jgi:RNA polymerase sigma-70 factor, ECF subfamily
MDSCVPPLNFAATATDEDLMLRYQAGEKEAFRLLYFRYHVRLHRFVARLLPTNRTEAEDVFQETWLAVVHGKERYARTAKFATYLFSIAHRRVADRWRKQYRQGGAPQHDAEFVCAAEGPQPHDPRPGTSTPEGMAENRDVGRCLREAVLSLPIAQRAVFLMKAEGELSLDEIATITGVTRETAKSRLRYALDKLRPALEHLK